MAKHFDANCLAAATEAAAKAGKITAQDVLDAFERVDAYRSRLEASGEPTGKDARIRKFAAEEAQKTRIAAAVKRRHTALNIIVREKQLDAMRAQVGEGQTRQQALVASILGVQNGVKYARDSFVNLEAGYTGKYVTGGLAKDIRLERPHIERLLENKKFDEDVTRELSEIRKDGKPGITGNEDAKWLARKIADYRELARTDANSLGASIGKLDGYFGHQNHDPNKMLKDGPDKWADRILTRLDVERTFPEGPSRDEARAILRDMYFTITTGFSANKTSAAEMGQRVGPANLAKSLGKSRVLHFKNVDMALDYRAEYGYGNTIEGAFTELRRMAHVNAAMKSFGPNPEVMIKALAETLKKDIAADPALSPDERVKQTRELDDGFGTVKYGINSLTGEASRPGNVTLAQIGSEIRSLEVLSKLGSMLFAQAGDTITPAIAAAFRGSNPFGAFIHQLKSYFDGMEPADVREKAYLWSEGLDGMIGNVVNAHVADDMRLGVLSKQTHTFFKWVGATWVTDKQRAGAARYIVAEMGMRGEKAFADLPPRYSHWLSMHGVDATKWEALRQAREKASNGRYYITPDRILELPDSAIEPLVADRLARARETGKGDPARILADARDDLLMTARRMIADETNYAILQSDASTRRFTTLGTRPGTVEGEIMRNIMQFKGFPAAFTQRVLGRAAYGRRKSGTKAERAGEFATHIGTLVAGLFIAGYFSMVLKDIAKGYWPPRDITDERTIMAALLQSGAAGIYGDFLFAQVDRFGGGATEKFIGPAFGSVGDLLNLGSDAVGYAVSGGEDPFSGSALMNWAVGQNPVWPANLWYSRPILDFLVLNSMRESLSPGYLRRAVKKRRTEYGQERWFPQAMGQ